jgi:hypothetical protein
MSTAAPPLGTGGIVSAVAGFGAFASVAAPTPDDVARLADACGHIVHALGTSHAPVLVAARSDMERNIDILRRRVAELQQEGAAGTGTGALVARHEIGRSGTATESLIWLGELRAAQLVSRGAGHAAAQRRPIALRAIDSRGA